MSLPSINPEHEPDLNYNALLKYEHEDGRVATISIQQGYVQATAQFVDMVLLGQGFELTEENVK